MLPSNDFPKSINELGIESLLSNDYMLAFFKKFCSAVSSRTRKRKKRRNSIHEDEDFLRVFFLSEIMGRSIHDTSEMLNEHLSQSRKGRRKTFTDGRKRRLVPHQTEVNKFLRMIGLQKARNILQECLDTQLKDALALELISEKVDILIDFTEHPYYGKRDDKMIKGTNRQKGTRKMRHYLGFSFLSRGTHLFAGLEHVANGQSKIPIIIKFLDHVLDLGFKLRFVMMDREFYRAELLDAIKERGGDVLIPAKTYKKVQRFIISYLEDTGNRVRKYEFSTATEAKRHFSRNVYLIIKPKRGFSLLSIKREFKKGNLSLADAKKRIFSIMTTQKPRGKSSSWACRISLRYRDRWNIETGFADLNRINRRWRSNQDNVRFLDMSARVLLYNSWKINRALVEKQAKQGNKKKSLTLQQNQDILKRSFLASEKKSTVVIG